MIGSSNEASLNGVLWPDAELMEVKVDYDSVSLTVRESTGTTKCVRADGYIGYCLIGFWDEIVVERAELVLTHPSIDQCLASLRERLGQHPPSSGNTARNRFDFAALLLHISDGSCFWIVAADFGIK
jgi:hypothetical protein